VSGSENYRLALSGEKYLATVFASSQRHMASKQLQNGNSLFPPSRNVC